MRAHGIETYDELVHRSVEDIGWFWDAVVRDLDIEFFEPYLEVFDTRSGVEWTTWFTAGTLNVAHQCVDRWAGRTPDAAAVIGEGEDGSVLTWTYGDLRDRTDRLARGLRSLGVEARDTVGIFLPMIPEAIAAIMACSKIGAIWVPIFSGFGPDAVAARLADARTKVLITADASLRKGQVVPMKATADRAVEIAGRVEHIVVLRHLDDPGTPWNEERDRWWDELADDDEPLPAEVLEAEHPLFIGYTSGTTGKPKGVVHVHGGFLVKIAEEVAYQVDLHPGEVLHWATDLGWIMGPWEIVGSLALGATVLLFEGAPTHPGPDRLWSLVERHGVTALGVSPTLIRALIPHGLDPIRAHDLSSLRVLASTGEPWDPRVLRLVVRGGRWREPADHQPVRRDGGRGVLLVSDADLRAEAAHPPRPGARHGRRHLGSRRYARGTERGRRARLHPAVAVDDARDLGRRPAVPRHLLVALARGVGPRRLGRP